MSVAESAATGISHAVPEGVLMTGAGPAASRSHRERLAMIAMRRVLNGSRDVETGMQVRVVRPQPIAAPAAERRQAARRLASRTSIDTRMDAHRMATERRWWQLGGR